MFFNCSRIHLAVPDHQHLVEYFSELEKNKDTPNLATLIKHANVLQERYASADAYPQALSAELMSEAPNEFKIPTGTPWAASLSSLPHSTEEQPDAHQEVDNFDCDRVLANSILFICEFSWWIELAYAIPEGDIGRAWEIIKVSCC